MKVKNMSYGGELAGLPVYVVESMPDDEVRLVRFFGNPASLGLCAGPKAFVELGRVIGIRNPIPGEPEPS